MHIENTRIERTSIQTGGPGDRPADRTPAPAPVAGVQRAARVDRVEISDTARDLARAGQTERGEELSPEVIESIRARIAAGDYDAADVLHHVARRIIADPDFRQGAESI